MKTRELIRRLQEADPSGETECCVDNHDIFFVERQFAFYDGALEILIRDPTRQPNYDVVGGIIRRTGEKVRIHVLSLEDAIFDSKDGQLPVEIEAADDVSRKSIEENVQRWRDDARTSKPLEG
jgi:hypothetical protein